MQQLSVAISEELFLSMQHSLTRANVLHAPTMARQCCLEQSACVCAGLGLMVITVKYGHQIIIQVCELIE